MSRKPRTSKSKSPWSLIIFILTVLVVGLGQWTVKEINKGTKDNASTQEPASSTWLKVVAVMDGDTFKLENGHKVRLIGIDTPESHDNPKLQKDVKKLNISRRVILEMGQKAAAFTKDLLEGQLVRLEYDVQPHDRYGRDLAYVYLQDGRMVNEWIIAQGYAYPLTIPPNVKYADRFKELFNEAREQRRGLWKE